MGYFISENCKLDHKIAFFCKRLNTKILVKQETIVTDRKMYGLKELIKRKIKMSEDLRITENLGLSVKKSGKYFISKMEGTIFQMKPKQLAISLCITHYSHY